MNKKTSQMQVGVQIKTKSNGTIDRYKVHLVAKGYSQTSRVDYFETFVLVVKYDSICTMLALAIVEDMELL